MLRVVRGSAKAFAVLHVSRNRNGHSPPLDRTDSREEGTYVLGHLGTQAAQADEQRASLAEAVLGEFCRSRR